MAKEMKSMTMDGNTAAAYVSYAFTDVAGIYPITPSTNMAESVDEWSAQGKENLFGQTVSVMEMQSEAGAAGTVHGSLAAGALTTTYTASQGLLLMIPNMYKMAGELLPAVFHVSARSIASHALNIFGDHQDVMACRQTGFAMLASGSVQESMDLAGVAHLAAIKSSVPFLHFFDGFRTSHEIQKIEVIDYKEFARLLDYDAVNAFRRRALNPDNPVTRGTAQNPDIFFQAREASNQYYDRVPEVVVDYMNEISEITGRDYKPFNYYGAEDAESIIVAMGSVTDTIEETIDYLNARGEKVGLIKVRLYRPFIGKYFFDVLPKSVKSIAVLDRTKEPGSIAEPLHLDINSLYTGKKDAPVIVGGRYGLGSKDTTPSQIKAVYDNLKLNEPKDGFTVGIVDDVTFHSLPINESIVTEPEGTVRCKFWGLGSDGTVGANKSAIKIIGDNTDMYAQAYFAYDSKKSGGITVSHLRFGKEKIRSTYLIEESDFTSCSNQSYVNKYDLLKGLRKGGTFLLNSMWTSEEVEKHIPNYMKKYMADNEIKFYTVNATGIADEIGLGNRINMVMQSAFFKLADVIPVDEAVKYLKDSIVKAYGKKGEKIVNMNYEAVDKGIDALNEIQVKSSWSDLSLTDEPCETDQLPDFIKNIAMPINDQKGDDLPVSAFIDRADGTFPNGTTAFEKRGIAVTVPEWQIDNCIQCNQCSFVCPHAVIRPFLVNEEERKNAPDGFNTKKATGKGLEEVEYRIQVSPLDCTGCGNCADICPAPKKALIMKPFEEQVELEADNWEYAAANVTYKDTYMAKTTVKGSQFAQPLLEFSGACAGCGETNYVKTITQLFGDRMLVANATGCSSIWGGSAPSTPYCKNAEGKGPAWANSLFEDNAEFGMGMHLAVTQMRDRLTDLSNEIVALDVSQEIKDAFSAWLESKEDGDESKVATEKVLAVLDSEVSDERAQFILREVKEKEEFLIKKSTWIFGGDGWAYDIGFGGLDHVLASGENINVLVMDTEVYSNTGGQASKSTPAAAVAKFAASGKKTKKKDLGLMMQTYGYVYVAQVAIGADKNQFMKALIEAEKYDGPSLIIAYSPCINHGIKEGMGRSMANAEQAVKCGYWHLYRFNPELKDQGKNRFVLDSKAPTESFADFLKGQVRYTSLAKSNPDMAEQLFAMTEEQAVERYETYKELAEKPVK